MLTSMVAYTEANGLQNYFENYQEVKAIRSEMDGVMEIVEDAVVKGSGKDMVEAKKEISR